MFCHCSIFLKYNYRAKFPWGELSMGQNVLGRVELTMGKFSIGRNVPGVSCPWGKLSMRRNDCGAKCHGASFDGARCPGKLYTPVCDSS